MPRRSKRNKAASTTSSDRSQQTTAERGQSALLSRLPSEIRSKIWEFVIGNQVVHLDYKGVKPRKIYLYAKLRPFDRFATDAIWPLDKESERWRPVRRTVARRREGFALLLTPLLTCRQIYTEALPLVYGTNLFTFRHISALHSFLGSRLPAQASLIRHLCLYARDPDDFEGAEGADSRLVTSLSGLQALHIYLGDEAHERAVQRYGDGPDSDVLVEGFWRTRFAAIEVFKTLNIARVKVVLERREGQDLDEEYVLWAQAFQDYLMGRLGPAPSGRVSEDEVA